MRSRLFAFPGFLCAMALVTHGAIAQQGATFTGRVTSEAGAPLASASVFIDQLHVGTITGEDGTYRFTVPSARVDGAAATITARLIGFRELSKPVTVTAGDHTVDFALAANPLRLGEVVVTGEGTTSAREKLGNVINTVDSSLIRRSSETNPVQALAGKAPNVQVNQQSGEPGASSSIRIRGLKTITGDGQPLFVVDGVPIDNSTIETEANPLGGTSASNRAGDINPDDIQSVSILKGAAAAAIYGARAGQGVVLITTKHGTAGKTSYSLRSMYTFDDVTQGIPLQTDYGHGSRGVTPACDASNSTPQFDCLATSLSWGPKLAAGTPTFAHFDDLFDTGHTWDNFLSASGGNDRTLFYVSGGRTAQHGIIVGPNDFYDKTTARVNASHRILDQLKIGADLSYVDARGGFVQKGSNVSGLLLGALRTPPEFDNHEFLDPTTGLHRSYRFPFPSSASLDDGRGYDNPFFVIYEEPSTQNLNRIYGNANATWDPFEWLDVKETFGADYYTDSRLEAYPNTASNQPSGQVTKADFNNYVLDQNLTATATHTFSPDFSGSLTIGQNLNSTNFHQIQVTGVTLVAPQPLNLLNTVTWTPNDFQSLIHGEAYFGQATADLFNQLYLTAALRNDGFSSFGTSSRRHWFPKGSIAWTFRQVPQSGQGIFTYGKARLAYGETGTQPPAYATNQFYQVGQFVFDAGWGSALLENQNGFGGLLLSANKAQPNLGPERTKELETGIDFGLFDQKVDGGVTFYNDRSVGVIFQSPLPTSTGFFSQAQNAATLRNRGWEVQLNYRPVTTANLQWELGAQWAKNNNSVVSLAGQQFVDLAAGGGGGFEGAVPTVWAGSEAGVLRGNDFVRCGRGVVLGGVNIDSLSTSSGGCAGAPKGALYIDTNGEPILDPTQRVIAVGSPDWTGSIRTSLTFHKVTLSGLLDIKHGGQIWNGTRGALYNFGTHKDTDIRSQTVTFGKDFMSGPVAGPGAGTPVDFSAIADPSTGLTVGQAWFTGNGGGFGPVAAQFVENGGYTKLREIGLAYTIDQRWVHSALGLSSIDLRVAGRNLHTWTKYRGIDPETNLAGAQVAIQDIDYFNNPQARSFVINVGLNR